MLPRSMCYDFYGLPIYYRLENRNEAPVYSLSLYDTWSHPGNGKKLCEKNLRLPKGHEGKSEEVIMEQLIPKFLRLAFPSPFVSAQMGKAGDWRESALRHLPLATVLAIDSDNIIDFNSWSKETARDFKYAAEWLTENHGRKLLHEIVPDTIGESLPHAKYTRVYAIAWTLQFLFLYETFRGVQLDNHWEEYANTIRRTHRNRRISGRKQTNLEYIPKDDLQQILRVALNALKVSQDSRTFAYLLFLATPLSLEEICALTFGDFEYLHEYDGLVIHITKTCAKPEGGKNYRLTDISDSYACRDYPLPSILRQAFQYLKPASSDYFLVPHPTSPRKRFPPNQFLQYIWDNYLNIKSRKTRIPYKKSRIQHLIKQTVMSNLSSCSFEEDELLFLYGKRPESTAGLYYCDFGAEGELYRLSALQDRWLSKYVLPVREEYLEDGNPMEKQGIQKGKRQREDVLDFSYLLYQNPVPQDYVLSDKESSFVILSNPGKLLAATIDLSIKPARKPEPPSAPKSQSEALTTDMLVFRLCAERGLSAIINWEVDEIE